MWTPLALKFLVVFGFACVVAAVLLWPVGGDVSGVRSALRAPGLDLSGFPGDAPARPLNVAFLHHSVGSYLLASPGPERGQAGGYPTHPNGGSLAALLARNNYRLHQATYGSRIGERTDLFDWLPKFRADMQDILTLKHQDERLPGGERNQVVIFKSCYPNNDFVGGPEGEGSAAGPGLTLANARATMNAVRDELAKYPEVLFVYVTAPPLAPRTWPERQWKVWAKKAMGRATHREEVLQSGAIARQFNTWVKDTGGWLKGYPHRNIVVFDLYDLLTDRGASDFSRYPSGDGSDSHPSRQGNERVAPELVAFLNRAVRYAGIAQ